MIICAGEILADLIGREENGRVLYERFAGGAPFNVACGLKQLGARCGFFGRVGSFEAGYEFDALVLDDALWPSLRPLAPEKRLERLVYLGDERCLRQKYVQGRKIFG